MATATIRVLTYLVTLQPTDSGDVTSVWNAEKIAKAFIEANRIWKPADIVFAAEAPIAKTVVITAKDGGDTWPDFVNSLSPQNRKCVGVGFLYDLPGPEGGDGGGRIALISGRKAGMGDAGFAGNLLAHELGHVLIDDPEHKLAGKDPANLMYYKRGATDRPEKLTAEQIAKAQETAGRFAP